MGTALVFLHASAGVVAFVAGLLAMLRRGDRRALHLGYLAGLVVMLVGLLGVVALRWSELDRTGRAVDLGLTLLAGYMLLRAVRAGRRRARGEWDGYLDDLGFTLIALFDGFAIVAAIDVGAPGWLVAVVAVAAVVVGIAGTNRLKGRRSTVPARDGAKRG